MGTCRTAIWAAPVVTLTIILTAQGSEGISHTLPLFDQNLMDEGNMSQLVNLLLENATMANSDDQDYQELELGSLYHITKVHGNSHDAAEYGETSSKRPTEKDEDQSEPELANLRSYKGLGPKLITGNDIADDHHNQRWWDSEETTFSSYPQLGSSEGSRKKRTPQSISEQGIPNINPSGAVGSAVDAALQIGCEVVDLVMGHMDELYKKCADGPVIPDEVPAGGRKGRSFVSDRTNCVSKSGPPSYKNIKVTDMRNLPRALKRIVHKAVLETLRTTNETPVGPELTSAFRRILEKRGAAKGYNLSKLDVMLGCINTWDVSINLWNGHSWMVAAVGDLTVFLWHNGK